MPEKKSEPLLAVQGFWPKYLNAGFEHAAHSLRSPAHRRKGRRLIGAGASRDKTIALAEASAAKVSVRVVLPAADVCLH